MIKALQMLLTSLLMWFVLAWCAFVLICQVAAQPTGTNTIPPGVIITGPKPVLTGTCTTGNQIGGTTAGSFTATCTAQTVIMTFPFSAPNGWACDAHDETTPADVFNQSAHSTTSASFAATTTAAADVVSFKCVGY